MASSISPEKLSNSKISASQSKTLHEVEIAGVKLKLKTSNNIDRVNQLVELVDTEVTKALDMSQTRSLQNAALVAALNLAEELIRQKETAQTDLQTLKKQAQSIISDLESSQLPQTDH